MYINIGVAQWHKMKHFYYKKKKKKNCMADYK